MKTHANIWSRRLCDVNGKTASHFADCGKCEDTIQQMILLLREAAEGPDVQREARQFLQQFYPARRKRSA